MGIARYIRAATSINRRRPCFTLIELLVVIAIIGILSGMVMYALAGAQRDSLVARTQGTLKKINEIVLYNWEEFRYRAVKVNVPDNYLYRLTAGAQQGQTPLSPREGARLRLMILRDTMRMELPDQYRDIEYTPTIYHAAVFQDSGTPAVMSPAISRNVPGVYNNFRRAFGLPMVVTPYTGAVAATVTVTRGATDNPAWDSAELLYQLLLHPITTAPMVLSIFVRRKLVMWIRMVIPSCWMLGVHLSASFAGLRVTAVE